MAQRYLLVALVALAVGVTIDVPLVSARLPGLTGGGPNVPDLAKHILVVVAAGAVREVVRSIALTPAQAARRRARRVLTTAGAASALSVMFARAPVHEEQLPGLTIAAVGEPVLLVYWAVYLAALASALVGIARVAFTAVKTYPASHVRTGMAWMGAGSVLGLAYCAHKAIYLATATSGIAVPDADTMDKLQSALLNLTALAFVVGLLWPTVTRWPVLRHLIAFRAYRKIHPLWQAYVEVEPDIAFNNTGKARLRDIEFRLYRRVIEIRDGMLVVRPYAGERLREIALREATRDGHKNPELVGEAAWLELARRNKLRGDPPCQDSVPVPAGGADPASETHLLTRISVAWPAVVAVAEQVEELTGYRDEQPMSQTSTTPTRIDQLATLLTNLFASAHLVISLLLVAGAASHPSPLRGLAWGAVAALLVGVLPYAWVLQAVRKGRFPSYHVPDRTQRMLPLGIASAAAIGGPAILLVLDAPRSLTSLIFAMLAGLGVTAGITRYWKISLHTGVAAGTATILTSVFGPGLLATGVLVAAIGWSRVQLRDHTPLQVISGAIVGTVVAAAVFIPLR